VEITRRCGVRLIVVERPGFGISDFKPGRSLLDYARDVAELADALELRRFCIAGVSGGGPSLAACAHALPERVIAVGMIGCGGPPDAPGALDGMAAQRKHFAALYRYAPGLAAALMKLMRLDRNPERFYRLMMQGMTDSDVARVRDPEVWRTRIDHVREAMRQGTRGLASTIPNVNARFLPGEGHFLCYDHFEEILRAVTRHATADPGA
jgi:pimeloyl-ACP methyl ester carboxylesterase